MPAKKTTWLRPGITTIALLSFAFLSAGCSAGKPKISSLGNSSGVKPLQTSTKTNFASSANTAVSGSLKVKFTMGYNQGAAAPAQTSVTSGSLVVRSSSAGVLNE